MIVYKIFQQSIIDYSSRLQVFSQNHTVNKKRLEDSFYGIFERQKRNNQQWNEICSITFGSHRNRLTGSNEVKTELRRKCSWRHSLGEIKNPKWNKLNWNREKLFTKVWNFINKRFNLIEKVKQVRLILQQKWKPTKKIKNCWKNIWWFETSKIYLTNLSRYRFLFNNYLNIIEGIKQI